MRKERIKLVSKERRNKEPEEQKRRSIRKKDGRAADE
jgi:hypothetical protein